VSQASAHRSWGLEDRVGFLGGVPLFGGLAPDMVRSVAQRFGVKTVERGGFVFLEGDRATSLNVLAEGRVKVIRETDEGREVILRQIDPGEIFGGAGGWGSATYPASARAQERSVVLRLPAEQFTTLIREQPDFAMAVVAELGRRLREAEARIRDLQSERVERRLARALLRLANKTGTRHADGIELGVPLTRQDLAELAGTTLSTASRTLSAWDQQGIVASARERVTILRPHALVAIAEDLSTSIS
jgi:CRP/FNR family transcriptional regulator, nitrogen oxide reductase regulator